jgi:uncharacterized protein (DUF2267 family)
VSTTGIEAWDTEVARTRAWLDDLVARLGWHDRHKAYLVLRAVLHGLRDHLDVEAAATLAQGLPGLLRGDVLDGWRPGDKPLPLASREEFLERVHDAMHRDVAVDPEVVARAVLAQLQDRLPPSLAEEVRAVSPMPLRGLWPA